MGSASKVVFQLLLVALVCHFCWTVYRDVQWQLMEQEWIDMKKISECKLEYVQNRCSEGLRPALVQKCEEWWHCAQLDSHPSVHQMASLYATTLAQTLNSFVQALAFRTILLLLVLIYVSRRVL